MDDLEYSGIYQNEKLSKNNFFIWAYPGNNVVFFDYWTKQKNIEEISSR
jgi:hypothetical protein